MRILYVIFVLCVGALLFTALAAARHIRRHESKRKAAEEEPASTSQASREKPVLVSAGKVCGDT